MAERQASREWDPQIEALRGQKKAVRRQYRRDVAANRGTVAYTQDAINQVPLKGLSGRYRNQVAAEMALSSKDVAAALPSMNAEARLAMREGLSEISSDVLDARIDKQQEAANDYESLYSKAATYFSSKGDEASDRAEKRKAKRQRQQDLHVASRRAMTLLLTTKEDFRPWGDKSVRQFGSEDNAWRAFERQLAREAEIPDPAAEAAIRRLRKRLEQSSLRGRTNPEIQRQGLDPSQVRRSFQVARRLGY
jgi:hypothetical protein